MSKEKNKSKSFEGFTNLYELSKTLRFELKPVGKTLENMKEHLQYGKEHPQYDKELQTFLKDQNIENAYQTLKPKIDEIHETFITESLESKIAKEIDFSQYPKAYKNKKEKWNKFKEQEKVLRKQIGNTYSEGGTKLKEKYPNLKWKKGSSEARGYNMLFSSDILEAVRQNNDNEKIQNALNEFKQKKTKDQEAKNFFTYLSGFNQNRENYYEIKDEKATAIATRIVHENLPKFCDNALCFDSVRKIKNKKTGEEKAILSKKEKYLGIFNFLKEKNIILQDKEKNPLVPILEEIFNILYFSKCLSQKEIEEYNGKIGNANYLVNLYNQQQAEKTEILPQFKTLYKQIGCGKRDSLFFALKYDKELDVKNEDRKDENEIFSVEKVLELASQAGKKYFVEKSDDGVVNTVPEFIDWLKENHNDWSGIYWSSKAINTISNKYLANWYSVIELIQDNHKEYKSVATYNKQREQQVKLNDAVELKGLFELLDKTVEESDEKWWESFFKKSILEEKEKLEIIKNENSPSKALMMLLYLDIEEYAEKFNKGSKDILGLEKYKTDKNKKKIKAWMDNGLRVNQMLKYFLVNENKTKGDTLNGDLVNILNTLIKGEKEEVDWFKWYDALRNYLTKKPQDDVKENKLKLNFDTNKGNLLGGFVDSHTENSDNATQYGSYLFRKKNNQLENYEYFLGISKDVKLFRCYLKDQVADNDKSGYERLEYYQPKSTTFFSSQYSKNKGELLKLILKKIENKFKESQVLVLEDKLVDFNILKETFLKAPTPTFLIDKILKDKKFNELIPNDKDSLVNILSGSELQDYCNKMIKEMQEFVISYKNNNPELNEVIGENYLGYIGLKSIIEKLQAVAKTSRVYKYFHVSEKEFLNALEYKDNPLYVFQITNKDLYKIKPKNLHSKYFQYLFSSNQDIMDIGKGEIFYRQQGLKEKQVKKGYERKPWIIEGKRFTKNEDLEDSKKNIETDGKSFFFHLSIFINYKEKSYSKPEYALSEINEHVNKNLLKDNDEVYFLGLDRGEKHLIYYSLVDQQGNIVPDGQGSLNLDFKDKDGKPRIIKKDKWVYDKSAEKWKLNKDFPCKNYNDLLDVATSNRDEARKNWQTIGNIRNLKEGYISQVIHEIVKKIIDKPTFVVLEDLNTGFKRGRQKIEKQVYQKFELALAKKLNFIVDKSKEIGEIGSVTNALQLTPPVANYQDIENKKQVGIMFYTRANYTSQTDPVTGWRKTIYLKKGSEKSIKDQIIGNGKAGKDEIKPAFTDIGFDGKDYFFEYEDKNVGKKWKLWSGKDGEDLIRYRGKRTKDKNIWETEKIALKERLDKIFDKNDFDKSKSLFVQIREGVEIKKSDDKFTAWESLRFVIDLIQQIRNSGGENTPTEDDNFLLSPARDEKNGIHFDSRKIEKKDSLPIDADANGAFNIARKGVMMHKHIQQWIKDGQKKDNLDLFISDKEWDMYLKDCEEWKKKLFIFSSRKAMEEERKNYKK